MSTQKDKYIEALSLYWDQSASLTLTGVDWPGNNLTADAIIEGVANERMLLRGLFDQKNQALLTGIFLDDSPAGLILGLALALEGIPQAILPIYGGKSELDLLVKRLRITHVFGMSCPSTALQSRFIANSSQGIPLWQYERYSRRLSHGDANDQSSTKCLSDNGSPLFVGTTSATTSNNPGIVTSYSRGLLEQIMIKRWSPYSIIKRPLLGPDMQNWSSRYNKIRYLLQGRGLVIRDVEHPLADQGVPGDCDGTLMAPSTLRRRLAKGDLKYFGDGFLIISGADRVSMDLRRAVIQASPVRLGITYATSQTGPLTWLPPEGLLDEMDSVGWPLPDVKIEPLATSNTLKRDNLTFTEVWIETPRQCLNPGDFLAISSSGQVIFGGRSSEVFLFNSLLISPFEIEDVLRRHPGVEDCAAFGANSKRFGSVPMAALTIKSGWSSDVLLPSLDELCREALGIRRPRRIIIMEEIPKGSTGKTLRRELSNLYSLKQ